MTLAEFLALLKECPLIASVQASPGSPLDDTETLLKLAQASLSQGVKILRLEGVENIKRIKGETGVPVIGLIKRRYPDSELYITPTVREVVELIETGCEVIAIDARRCPRPGREGLEQLVSRCHEGGRLVLADCKDVGDLSLAQAALCDLGSTTFSDPWPYIGSETSMVPEFSELQACLREASVPVLAEGGYLTEAHVRTAVRMGAAGVVVGGALNDPVKSTRRFVRAAATPREAVGAADIGGTWIRYASFGSDWKLREVRRAKVHPTHRQRIGWIARQALSDQVRIVGVSTGGVYDPRCSHMEESKDTIADNLDIGFDGWNLEWRVLNDGLASAWGHACWMDRRPDFSFVTGDTVATLALGTGIGCGIVTRYGFSSGYSYPRLNDLEFEDGASFEQVLGGAALTESPSSEQRRTAQRALLRLLEIVGAVALPDMMVLCGGVLNSPWMLELLGNPAVGEEIVLGPTYEEARGRFRCTWIARSPFGEDAGLYGAAALALWPPIGVFPE